MGKSKTTPALKRLNQYDFAEVIDRLNQVR